MRSGIVGASLSAEGLSYAYPQHGLGLPETDFSAEPGEFWILSGRSGCGKSTLARCLTGLIPHLYRGKMTGAVRVGGLDTRTTPLWRLSECAGLLFQNPAAQSVASTVEDEVLVGLENLGLPRSEMGSRLESSLSRFGLDGCRQRDPATLSGCETQRLMLAATLARQPRALVLDEPLSMLDPTAASELVQHLESLAREGTAVVACEHRADYFRQSSIAMERHLPWSSQGEEPAPIHAPPQRSDGGVILRDVCLSHGDWELCSEIDLVLPGGSVIALVGRNGVGKTTLLRAIAGLHPFNGQIMAQGGGPVRVGLVFQNADRQVFLPSVRQEIRHAVEEPDELWYDWLLDALSLRRYEETPPLLLSEGEKKRLAAATILMREHSQGILVDEPTLGQDAHHAAIMGRTARAVAASGAMFVAATHDLAWAKRYADRLILLGKGGILAGGNPDVVLAQREPWRRAGLTVPTWLFAAQPVGAP